MNVRISRRSFVAAVVGAGIAAALPGTGGTSPAEEDEEPPIQ